MNEDTVSTDPSTLCPSCGSSNWLKKEADDVYLPSHMPLGQLICQDCACIWDFQAAPQG